MKHIYIIGLLFLFIHVNTQAQTMSKEYQFPIDTSQYSISIDTSGLATIHGPGYYSSNDNTTPRIPYFYTRILLPYGTEVDSCLLIRNNLNLWKDNIELAPNELDIPIETEFVATDLTKINYPDSIYPVKDILYGEEEKSGYVITWVVFSPMVYNTRLSQVNISSSLTVSLKLKQRSNIIKPQLDRSTIETIKGIVINPQETDSYLIAGENTERGFSSLNVHAIPNNGEVTIQLSESYNTPFQLELFTLDGKKVKNIMLEPEQTEIIINDLKGGFYLYRLKGENGMQFNGKLMTH